MRSASRRVTAACSTRSSLVSRNPDAGWLAATDSVRYRSVKGAAETEAMRRPVHVAISYHGDGTIQVFRDGRPYGKPYKSNGPVLFPRGETRVVFGLRHAPVGGNKMLAGTIVRARLYDRALNATEVAESFESAGDYVTAESIIAALSPELRDEREPVGGRDRETPCLG